MALKKNSATLLWWLCTEQGESWIAASDLPFLLPELSDGGRRSLVSLLFKEQYIEKVSPQVAGLTMYSSTQILRATEYGVQALRSQFSSFKYMNEPWKGEWSIIAFFESPKTDPQFRYLRTKLLAIHAGQLKSGLYIYPGELPEEVLKQLTQLYVGSVAVWKTQQWRFGDERRIVGSIFGIQDTAQALSGISSELDSLLAKIDDKKRLTESQKSALFMVFNRFVSIVEDNVGIFSWYYPQVRSIKDVLHTFHSIYTL